MAAAVAVEVVPQPLRCLAKEAVEVEEADRRGAGLGAVVVVAEEGVEGLLVVVQAMAVAEEDQALLSSVAWRCRLRQVCLDLMNPCSGVKVLL
jgi:hypothetical protein